MGKELGNITIVEDGILIGQGIDAVKIKGSNLAVVDAATKVSGNYPDNYPWDGSAYVYPVADIESGLDPTYPPDNVPVARIPKAIRDIKIAAVVYGTIPAVFATGTVCGDVVVFNKENGIWSPLDITPAPAPAALRAVQQIPPISIDSPDFVGIKATSPILGIAVPKINAVLVSPVVTCETWELERGKPYYVSQTEPGKLTTSPSSIFVGYSVSTKSIIFDPDIDIESSLNALKQALEDSVASINETITKVNEAFSTVEVDYKALVEETKQWLQTDYDTKINKVITDYQAADTVLDGKITAAKTELTAEINRVETTLDGKIDTLAARHDTELTDLRTTLANTKIELQTAITAVESALNEYKTYISNELTTKFAQVDTRFDEVADNFTTVNTAISNLDTAVDTINTTIDGIQSDITRIDGEIDAVEAKNTAQDATVSALTTKVSTIETTVTEHTTQITNLGTAKDELATRLDAVETGVGGVEGSLTNYAYNTEAQNAVYVDSVAGVDSVDAASPIPGVGTGHGSKTKPYKTLGFALLQLNKVRKINVKFVASTIFLKKGGTYPAPDVRISSNSILWLSYYGDDAAALHPIVTPYTEKNPTSYIEFRSPSTVLVGIMFMGNLSFANGAFAETRDIHANSITADYGTFVRVRNSTVLGLSDATIPYDGMIRCLRGSVIDVPITGTSGADGTLSTSENASYPLVQAATGASVVIGIKEASLDVPAGRPAANVSFNSSVYFENTPSSKFTAASMVGDDQSSLSFMAGPIS